MSGRAPWEGTGQPLTPDGKLIASRHTGMDQLAYAFDDIVRGVEAEAAAIATGRERVRRAAIGMELLARAGASFTASPVGVQGLGIPQL